MRRDDRTDPMAEQLTRLILFEDEHLLVVNKPAGWNTHAPAPYAGEGLYDWLRHREPRWATLAIVHRLDKETSGVMVFGKTTTANRSLTEQFAGRSVRKRYLFRTDRNVLSPAWNATSTIERAGERYASRPSPSRKNVDDANHAETRFRRLSSRPESTLVEAAPVTGRTHQIRVHAADHGCPILGDTLYGGTPWTRVCLHAGALSFAHPETREPMEFVVEVDFDDDPSTALREAIIDPAKTDAWRCRHGASDGRPGWYLDQLGSCALSQSDESVPPSEVKQLALGTGVCSVYHKRLDRQVRRTAKPDASPQLVAGTAAPEPLIIRENGVRFGLSFGEGYSVGLFLDQRDNRRRLLVNHVAANFPLWDGGLAGREVLNTFAYTCGFSVCAALAGARTTSLDLSRKYLEWGRRNFELNQLDPAGHDFIYGDVFNWLTRLARKGRAFDVVILDPPTFSQSKEGGVFRADHDLGRLVTAALPVLRRPGVLLTSTNAAGLAAEDFVAAVEGAVEKTGARVALRHYAPQPPDFPISRKEPAYLKTLWLRVVCKGLVCKR